MPRVKCLKAPLPNLGEVFRQTWIVFLELMGRLVGLKLDGIVIMRFHLDMGRLKSRRAKKSFMKVF